MFTSHLLQFHWYTSFSAGTPTFDALYYCIAYLADDEGGESILVGDSWNFGWLGSCSWYSCVHPFLQLLSGRRHPVITVVASPIRLLGLIQEPLRERSLFFGTFSSLACPFHAVFTRTTPIPWHLYLNWATVSTGTSTDMLDWCWARRRGWTRPRYHHLSLLASFCLRRASPSWRRTSTQMECWVDAHCCRIHSVCLSSRRPSLAPRPSSVDCGPGRSSALGPIRASLASKSSSTATVHSRSVRHA